MKKLKSDKEKVKMAFAKFLYRWQMSQTILGTLLSALTFSGVFTLLIGPLLSQFGLGYQYTLLVLVVLVAVIFLGFGTYLDRVIHFWTAQTMVGTTRNPFLISKLYQKEWLTMTNQHLPVVRALRALIAKSDIQDKDALLDELDSSIVRIEETIREREWVLREGEYIYED